MSKARVYKRKNPSGKIVYFIQYNGKRRVQPSKKVAYEIAKKINDKALLEEYGLEDSIVTKNNISLDYILQNYINSNKHTISKDWLRNYHIYRRHTLGYFGNINAMKIKLTDVKKYQQFRLSFGLKNKTVNNEINWLFACYKFAKESDLITKLPFEKIPRLPIQETIPKYLTKEELKKIKECDNQYLKDIILFLANTGLRLSEFERLGWEHISFETKSITIYTSKSKHLSGIRYRTIPMNKTTHDILQRHKENKIYKFKPFKKDLNLRRKFHNLARDLKIQKFNARTLRHTFASHLVLSDVPLYTVSKFLGHRNISQTQIYAHLTQVHLQKHINNLDI